VYLPGRYSKLFFSNSNDGYLMEKVWADVFGVGKIT
jgi:hypothetical protein